VTALLRRATGFLDRLAPIYERGLRASLRRPKTLLGIVGAAVAVSLGLAPLLGRDFLPASDVSDIRLEVVATPGISLEEMRERVAEVEAAIRQTVPEAEVITAEFGQAEGFTAIFGGRVNRANLRIRLMPPRQRTRSQREIEAALTERFADIPGLDVRVQRLALGGGTGGDIEVQIFGEDLDEVRRYAELLRDELGAVRGVRETRLTMSIGSPEIQVEFDRERMRVLGISPGQVASAVAAYYQGIAATTFREEGSEFLVRVRAPRGERRDLDGLRYLPIPLPGGGTVPLSSVATIGDRLGPTDIERENQRRYTSVIIDGEGRDLGALTERIEARIGELGVPEGLHYEISGMAEDLRDAFFKLALAIAAALCLVYMVMASQFESLLEPFVIMATVPLAIIGVVIALAVTGTSIQVTALVGVILLGGVVVNNGIVLIDVLKRRRAEGKDLEEATLEAGRTRLRPILMTAVTTIFGMIPPALGSGDGAELWAPLGRAVVGGMIASTLLALFVVPTLYVVVARWTDRRRARRGRGETDLQVLDRGAIAAQDEVTREAAE
jgi:HAE1 family hydrophobic/amphiphilic exporter-1